MTTFATSLYSWELGLSCSISLVIHSPRPTPGTIFKEKSHTSQSAEAYHAMTSTQIPRHYLQVVRDRASFLNCESSMPIGPLRQSEQKLEPGPVGGPELASSWDNRDFAYSNHITTFVIFVCSPLPSKIRLRHWTERKHHLCNFFTQRARNTTSYSQAHAMHKARQINLQPQASTTMVWL